MKDAKNCISHILKMTLDSGTHKNNQTGAQTWLLYFNSSEQDSITVVFCLEHYYSGS